MPNLRNVTVYAQLYVYELYLLDQIGAELNPAVPEACRDYKFSSLHILSTYRSKFQLSYCEPRIWILDGGHWSLPNG